MLRSVALRSVIRLPVTANVVFSSLSLATMMMEVICSSETYVLTTATKRNVQEDGILQFDVLLKAFFSLMYC
jgi:hypothetical protein